MNSREAFELALLTSRVAERHKLAKVFPTDDALKAYLAKHPKADKSKHSVKPKSDAKPEVGLDEKAKAKPKAKAKAKTTPHTHRDRAEELDRSGKHDKAFEQYSAAAELFRQRGDHAAAKSMDAAAKQQAKKWKKSQKKSKK